MTGASPIRVLHVVGAMNRGGIETWLMHVLRHVSRNAVKMDFLVHTELPGSFDEELQSLGSRLIRGARPSQPVRYIRRLNGSLREFGPYDVLHSHVHHFSGLVLRAGLTQHIPVRVAHSHLDTAASDSRASLARRSYLTLMRHWIRQCATDCIACSETAAAALFGATWRSDSRCKILHYGIALEPFTRDVDRVTIRRELGLLPDDLVIGHVGRFEPQKNHRAVLEITAAALRRDRRIRLLLVGGGSLQEDIAGLADRLGLHNRVVFCGVRGDVPGLMKEVMDVLLFPSINEGLPVTIIEAQAAGLPVVMSDVISRECVCVPQLVATIPLRAPHETWVDALFSVLQRGGRERRTGLVKQIEECGFNIARSTQDLLALYQGRRCPAEEGARCGAGNA